MPAGQRCPLPGEFQSGDVMIRVAPGLSAPADTTKGAMEWHRTLHRGDTVRIDNGARHTVVHTFVRGKASPCRLEPIDRTVSGPPPGAVAHRTVGRGPQQAVQFRLRWPGRKLGMIR